ncbi:hypothetical protein [Microvirga tunisiensis]|uniref:Uncharacterized protein n=1 Tax=Microvirga tunisiensis TaxID=2108360 RepID=A0A5N7MAA3_9HYPH|nr:hypothetical protein [Microvirga tunisiensis]MPR05651.1 hypothetical protein [Microvirga tunisiensis]MPR23851.1 hypothetical protein [Microvirga tunisiensis]
MALRAGTSDIAMSAGKAFLYYQLAQIVYGEIKEYLNAFLGTDKHRSDSWAQGIRDPSLEQALNNSGAGRDAVAAGQKIEALTQGQSLAGRAVDPTTHRGLGSYETGNLNQPHPTLGAGSQMVVRLPGETGQEFRLDMSGAHNDKEALNTLLSDYPNKARAFGLPPELPSGSSVMIGNRETGEDAREYQFVDGKTFLQNNSIDGSLDRASHAIGTSETYGSKDFSFNKEVIAVSDPRLIDAASFADQAKSSSLIVRESRYEGMESQQVVGPEGWFSKGDGEAMASLATSLGIQDGAGKVVQAHDVRTGENAVAVSGPSGMAAMSVDAQGGQHIVAQAQQGEWYRTVAVSAESDEKALSFDSQGQGHLTDKGVERLDNVSKFVSNASPMEELAQAVDGSARGAVVADLSGKEPLTAMRVSFDNENSQSQMDFIVKNGQLTITENSRADGKPIELAVIRDASIKVDPQSGAVEMGEKAQGLMKHALELGAEGGREGKTAMRMFAEAHPETQQFASVTDRQQSGQPNIFAQVAGSGDLAPNARGTMSGIVNQASQEADHIATAMPARVAQMPSVAKASLEIGG